MQYRLYGIKNCDSVKKARRWLEEREIAYEFVDFRVTPPDADLINRWADGVGWERLLNRRGTTWRELNPAQREEIDRVGAIALMCRYPTLIKRPVLEDDESLLVGFTPALYESLTQ